MSELDQSSPSAKQIFLIASDLTSDEERNAYLEQACGGNRLLRQQLDAMLRANAGADSNPLDRLGDMFGASKTRTKLQNDEAARPADVGRMIGPYKLLEQIGEGGFGTVYMAEQSAPIRRKVALKVLKPGMDSKEIIARFEAERQALAMMDHPNIARVLDGGTTPEGRPYFVMELVRGVPITEFCDEARLPNEERLRLFVGVCRAVQHAHQKGIIHRDLKPSNVLVTMHDDQAVPKVIDFGIAKAVSQPLTDRTLFTGYHQLLGTPMYMSPEQAQMSGIDVDTRSDVYSLGVLLYELLTGTTPFTRESLSNASFDELRKIIREQEPPRPSARLTTLDAQARSTAAGRRKLDQRRISDAVRGELDWIVMKTLEKDRNRRYESASALAADIERYLNQEAVQACPPTIGYQLHKFALRNRALIGTLMMVGLSLLAGVIGIAWQAANAETARQLAVQNSTKEREARKQADRERKRAAENYVRARDAIERMLTRVADGELGRVPEMAEIRSKLLRDAAEFYTELLERTPHDPVSFASRSRVYHLMLDYSKVRADLEKAIELDPDNANYHFRLGLFLANCPDTVYRDYPCAEMQLKWACRLSPSTANYHAGLATLYHFHQKNTEASHEAYQLAIQHSASPEERNKLLIHDALLMGDFRRVIELGRDVKMDHPEASWSYYRVAQAHRRLQECEESIATATKAIAAARLHKADSANELIFYLYVHRAMSYKALDLLEESLADLNKCLELAPFRSYEHKYRASLHFRLGHYAEAIADLRKALELSLTDLSALTWIPPDEIAACSDEEFRSQFLALVDETVEKCERSSEVLSIRAGILLSFGEPERAKADMKAAVTGSDPNYSSLYQLALLTLSFDGDAEYREICSRIISKFRDSKDPATQHFTAWTCALAPDALEDYTPVVHLARTSLAAEMTNQQYLGGLGAVLMRSGQFEEAQATLSKAIEAAANGQTSRSYAYYFLAMTEQHLGNADAAKEHLKRGIELAEEEFKQTPAWNRELTLKLLRAEAEQLILSNEDQ